MNAAKIRTLIRRGLARVAANEATREELLYLMAQIEMLNSDNLRLLERNGAPVSSAR